MFKQNQQTSGFIGATALMASVVLALAACGSSETAKVGFVGALTGRIADLGESGRRGAQLAIDDANAAGGLRGRKLELVVADDQQDAKSLQHIRAEFKRQGVAFVVGPMTSSMAEAALAPADDLGLVFVSPTSTAASLSSRDDALFKVVSSTRVHSRVLAKYLAQAGQRRVLCIVDSVNAVYTSDWMREFAGAFEAEHGVVASAEPFSSTNAGEIRSVVTKLKDQQFDGIHLVTSASDAVRLVKEIRAAGWTQPISTATWAGTEQLIELGGRLVEGVVFPQFFDRNNRSKQYLAFATSYVQRYDVQPGFASVASYDATMAVVHAMRSQTIWQSPKEALLAAGPYRGLQEEWQFDRFGDAERTAWITMIRDGTMVRAN